MSTITDEEQDTRLEELATQLATLEAEVRNFPQQLARVRDAWDTFVTAVDKDAKTVTAYRTYLQIARGVAAEKDRLEIAAQGRRSRHHRHIADVVNRCNERLAATAMAGVGGLGFTKTAPAMSPAQKDAEIAAVNRQLNRLAEQVGAPRWTPRADTDTRRVAVIDIHERPTGVSRLKSVTVVTSYADAIDQALTTLQ